MKLSKRSIYGIQASLRIAKRSTTGYVQSRDIAQNENLPGKFLESILLELRSSDLLESKVGAGGGYKLARPAEEIMLRDVLKALDTTDPDEVQAAPETDGEHAMAAINARLEHAIDESVGSLSLADLVTLSDEHRAGKTSPMYYI